MKIVGKVESLWRYPVKSMCGEELEEAFVSFAGIFGDRLFAFKSTGSSKDLPYLTGRDQAQMLLYRPRFRNPDTAARPPNLTEAEGSAPGLNPVVADPADLALEVETPSGETFAVDDPALIKMLSIGVEKKHVLTLARSERAMTDCRPISLFSIETGQQLSEEFGVDLDKRRFRANVYMALEEQAGFAEDAFVGKSLQIGSKTVLYVLERDPRCKMITLDPDTGECNPAILKTVVKTHDGMAGIYGAVIIEGTVRPGDTIRLLN